VTSWHARPESALAAELQTEAGNGLTPEQAARRLASDGPNEIERQTTRSALAIFAGQFASLVIWVLVGAAAISLALGDALDGVAILAILVLNGAIGFAQEYRSERAVAALAKLSAPNARVVRGGAVALVPAREVVSGDLLLLDAGDLVAADARLVEAAALRTNEAALTGESEPVEKRLAVLPESTPLADRCNSVFLGTSVMTGSARALVTATGARTELGGIAKLLETAERDETPLQRRLDRVARLLVWASLAIVALVFALGLLRGFERLALFVTAVSLAVAAIPEGLPAVVTLALSLGVERMAQRNSLVRRLAAVETLGSVDVICTDKTGTLTVGAMSVRGLFAAGGDLESLLWVAAACNDAELTLRDGQVEFLGDPTEAALLVEAEKRGIRRRDVERDSARVAVLPFDSERKLMTVVRRRGPALVAAVKGAPEVLLTRCTRVRSSSGTESLDEAGRERIRERVRLFAGDALRVLGFAERHLERYPSEGEVETELTFLGLAGLQDPPRPDARDSVARCGHAGIRTVMITGDHPDTARAIAAELGVLAPGDELVTGSELEELDDASLAARAPKTSVYARVTAAHKLRIVRAWKRHGAVVAMTGDGVNDAPALREASIGIAMGRTGTEVAKAAADIVITDDHFSTIVAAVEEGRRIFDNIRKTLGYLLAGNSAELAVMLLATLVGTPLPLLPVQLLWVNLVTDGLPALALASDPIDPGALDRPPRHPDSPFADRRLVGTILLTAALTSAVTFGSFAYELWRGSELAVARNAAFSVLTFAELLRAFGARSETRPIWVLGPFTNLPLFVVVVGSFALQVSIHQHPLLQAVFETEPIGLGQLVAWVGLAALPLAVLEAVKLLRGAQSEGKSRTSGGTRY
jgi:P-type Ca2+ transporter type 2C